MNPIFIQFLYLNGLKALKKYCKKTMDILNAFFCWFVKWSNFKRYSWRRTIYTTNKNLRRDMTNLAFPDLSRLELMFLTMWKVNFIDRKIINNIAGSLKAASNIQLLPGKTTTFLVSVKKMHAHIRFKRF